MKKNRLSFLLIVLVLFALLASCATSVRLTTLVPSEIDLSGYKTIAFASTTPYKQSFFFNKWLYDDTAKYISKAFSKALDQGVYNIVDSKTTDNYIQQAYNKGMTVRSMLLRHNIDALVTTKVEHQDYEEDIICRESRGKDGKVYKNYYVRQKARITISYVVHDVQTALIIDDGEYKYETPFINTTFIGSVEASKDNGYEPFIKTSVSPLELFEDIVDRFTTPFKKRLTPYSKTTSLALMKSKNTRLEAAFEYMENDMLKNALDEFMNEWNYSHDIAAGYNSILITASTQGLEKALDLANEVYSETFSTEVHDLKVQLTQMNSQNTKAKQQITGEKKKVSSVTELRGF